MPTGSQLQNKGALKSMLLKDSALLSNAHGIPSNHCWHDGITPIYEAALCPPVF